MSIQMQNPSISKPNNPDSNSSSFSSQHASNYPSPATETEPLLPMYHANHHRRAYSEDYYRILDDDDMGFSGNPFGKSSTPSVEELGSKDGFGEAEVVSSAIGGGGNVGCGEEKRVKTRLRQSSSADGLSRTGQGAFGELKESKKAIPPQQLAQLWSLDPKRAKRILANRQSAARSKERKARYISELERKVQMVQEEAASHSTQLTVFKRETMTLASENTQLKRRLQAMVQQARMRDAMNEALMQEVERLKIATGEIATPSESLNAGMPMAYSPSPSPSTLFSLPQQPAPSLSQLMPLHDDHPTLSPPSEQPESPSTLIFCRTICQAAYRGSI